MSLSSPPWRLTHYKGVFILQGTSKKEHNLEPSDGTTVHRITRDLRDAEKLMIRSTYGSGQYISARYLHEALKSAFPSASPTQPAVVSQTSNAHYRTFQTCSTISRWCLEVSPILFCFPTEGSWLNTRWSMRIQHHRSTRANWADRVSLVIAINVVVRLRSATELEVHLEFP